MQNWKKAELSELIGAVVTEVSDKNALLTLYCRDGRVFRFIHHQDCCESVYLESQTPKRVKSVLAGYKIVQAESVSSDKVGITDDEMNTADDESYTWTFYKIASTRGYLTLRFYGSSNGYYSESVDFEKAE